MSAKTPEFVFEYLKQVESLANDVLTDRRDIIELNKKRDKTREALRSLRKLENEGEDVWLCCGNLFLGLNKQQAVKLVDKDHENFDQQINDLHKGLKQKVSKLYDAEKKPELKDYDLIPLTKEEKQSIFDLVGKD